MLGIGWSKDNLQLGRDWQTASLQAIFAGLSLGPVGLADRLDDFPRPPTAGSKVRTNVTLAMALVAKNGMLLQPSVPLQPVAELLLELPPLGRHAGQIWTTHTAVHAAGTTAVPAVWFTVLGFANGKINATDWPLAATTFGPGVDFAAPQSNFSTVPKGSFGGTGYVLSGSYVWAPSSAVVAQGASWKSSPLGAESLVSLTTGTPDLAYVAPVLGGIVLFGENSKLAAVSTYRFETVTATPSGGVSVALRGAPGEVVELIYSVGGASGGPILRQNATVGPDGTTTVVITG